MSPLDRFRKPTADRTNRIAGEQRSDRRTNATYAGMIVGIVAVTLVGPSIVDGLSNRLQRPDVQSLGAPPTTETTIATTTPGDRGVPGAGSDPSPDTTSAPATSAPAASLPIVTTVPAVTLPATTVAPTSEPIDEPVGVAVSTIQLVPPLRDVIVEIDGREFASDQNGEIAIDSSSSDAMFDFIGIRAQPSLRSVAFGRWADGSPNAARSLSDVEGPVAQIGLVESHRVTVSTQQTTPDGAQIDFVSAAGSVRVDIGRTSWIPATLAVVDGDRLIAEDLEYSTGDLVSDAIERTIPEQDFRPTPEALWVVDIDPS